MEEKKMKKVKEKKKQLKTLDNVSSELQSSIYISCVS